jgi:pyrroline-5-carboxylate reductase
MFKFFSKKIGVIGFGNMGQAIAERANLNYQVCVFEKDRVKTRALIGIRVAENIGQLLKESQVIVLAIKPQDFDFVLSETKLGLKNKLVISIAAGITTDYIQNVLGKVRVVRVMPNLAVKVGQSTTVICKGAFAKNSDLKFTESLFNYVGRVFIMGEEQMDAATAISGSGPAYIFYDMEINHRDPLHISEEVGNEYKRRLNEAALSVGFDQKTAADLAECTTVSSISLSKQKFAPPEQLRRMVTSPGGTTEAALKVIVGGGSWAQAAQAAKKRAQELSKKG